MSLQYEDLYVTDPLALHYIIVKDQYIYEETSAFITYVPTNSVADASNEP